MKYKVEATLVCDLTDELQDRHFRTVSIGSKRDVLVLSTANPIEQETFFLKHLTHQFDIHHWHAGEVHRVALPPGPLFYHHVQQVGLKYICVDSRCSRDEKNAQIFDASGVQLHSWHAGDGIEDVQVSPNGQIWVSYFDEGVMSGELGHQGLVCFDAEGQRTFGFYDCPRGNYAIEEIIDCYALNVTSNRDTWLFYYSDFPLVHLREHRIHEVLLPSTEMRGSNAFAINHTFLLFAGGYQDRGSIFWRDTASDVQFELEVVGPEGEPLIWERAYGRGADLFLCDGPKVWMLSLNDIGF